MPSTSPKTADFTFDEGVRQIRASNMTAAQAAEKLISQLTDRELLWLLDGDVPLRSMIFLPGKIKAGPINGGTIDRLGIPGVRFSDGPRGVVMGHSTAFPVTMARAATWDKDLEEQVGLAMGREARAQGANYSGAVCINLLRHPAWGRAQESYGEDPVLTGDMGSALTAGLRKNVMACVKHYALNSMENARFRVDVVVDDHPLHEVYLPHFKKVIIGAGAETVMSSYNSVNGKFVGENKVLLTDILRDEWGFTGFVTSDWVSGTHDGLESLEAGMDIEMPVRMYRKRELPGAIRDGRLPKETVLVSARRILTTTLQHVADRDAEEPTPDVVASAKHRELAYQVAIRGSVLLKNATVGGAPVLPLDPGLKSLAVIGKLADVDNTGDHGSSLVFPPTTSTILDGLRRALPGTRITFEPGDDLAQAARTASTADAVVVVAGMSFDDEGERVENDDMDIGKVFGFPFTTRPAQWLMGALAKSGSQFGRGGDRSSLNLHEHDEALIKAVAAANAKTAVVTIAGAAVIMENWQDEVGAILHAWYPGMEGGRAVADILLGSEEPGGRLPAVVPTSEDHLPFFDAEANSIVYDEWWGQRKLDHDGHRAAYPFGFGLGYTTFDMALVDHTVGDTEGTARARVRNTGDRTGSTVVQVYAVDSSATAFVPQLIGFRRVELAAGEETTVEIDLDLTPTRERNPETREWTRRPGTWSIIAAPYSPNSGASAQPLFGSKATKREAK